MGQKSSSPEDHALVDDIETALPTAGGDEATASSLELSAASALIKKSGGITAAVASGGSSTEFGRLCISVLEQLQSRAPIRMKPAEYSDTKTPITLVSTNATTIAASAAPAPERASAAGHAKTDAVTVPILTPDIKTAPSTAAASPAVPLTGKAALDAANPKLKKPASTLTATIELLFMVIRRFRRARTTPAPAAVAAGAAAPDLKQLNAERDLFISTFLCDCMKALLSRPILRCDVDVVNNIIESAIDLIVDSFTFSPLVAAPPTTVGSAAATAPAPLLPPYLLEMSQCLRIIFDWRQPFYLLHGQEGEFDFEVDEHELIDTTDWARGLAVGTWLDVYDLERMTWSVGRVGRLTRDTLYVTPFVRATPIRLLDRGDTLQIAPYMTKATAIPRTDSESWRADWVVGARIDAMDCKKKWWNGTIVQIRKGAIGANSKAEADMICVRYDGWSEKWAEWLPRTSLRLAPYQKATGTVNYNLLTLQQEMNERAEEDRKHAASGGSTNPADDDLNDPNDDFANYRGRAADEKFCGSAFFVSAVNYFGDHSGFHTLLALPANSDAATAAAANGDDPWTCHDRLQWLCTAPLPIIQNVLEALVGMDSVLCLPFAAHALPGLICQIFHNVTRHATAAVTASLHQHQLNVLWNLVSKLYARLDKNRGHHHLDYIQFELTLRSCGLESFGDAKARAPFTESAATAVGGAGDATPVNAKQVLISIADAAADSKDEKRPAAGVITAGAAAPPVFTFAFPFAASVSYLVFLYWNPTPQHAPVWRQPASAYQFAVRRLGVTATELRSGQSKGYEFWRCGACSWVNALTQLACSECGASKERAIVVVSSKSTPQTLVPASHAAANAEARRDAKADSKPSITTIADPNRPNATPLDLLTGTVAASVDHTTATATAAAPHATARFYSQPIAAAEFQTKSGGSVSAATADTTHAVASGWLCDCGMVNAAVAPCTACKSQPPQPAKETP